MGLAFFSLFRQFTSPTDPLNMKFSQSFPNNNNNNNNRQGRYHYFVIFYSVYCISSKFRFELTLAMFVRGQETPKVGTKPKHFL